MTAKTTPKPGGGTDTDMIGAALDNPVVLFTDTERYSEFYARVKAETEKLVPDVSTVKGRDEIRSMARKVVTTKTTIEKAGKALTEEWRKKTADVTAARTKMVNELAALADEVRKPLTDWEDAEDERVKAAKEKIEWFQRCGVVTIADTSITVAERGAQVWDTVIDPVAFDGFVAQAEDAKKLAVELLLEAKTRLEEEEADRAELARLRKLEEERATKDAAEKEQREAEERKKAEERAAQERLEAAEREKAEREAHIAKEREEASQRAAEAARREAEQAVELEREAQIREQKRMEAEQQARIEAANERAAQAEAEVEERRRQDAAEAADRARREADKAHRTKIMSEAKLAIMSCGVEEQIARAIVLAIKAGEIPSVRIMF